MKSSDDIEIGSSLSFIIGNGLSESVKDCGLCGSGDVFTSCGISESAQDKHIIIISLYSTNSFFMFTKPLKMGLYLAKLSFNLSGNININTLCK